MIANALFEEYKKERKKIGIKRRYKKKNNIILYTIKILITLSFIPQYYIFKKNNLLLIGICIVIIIIIFNLLVFLEDHWDITDYEECNDRLIKGSKAIIINAYNRLKRKSQINIENETIFIDYVIDYISNLDEAKKNKLNLIGKIISIFIFPVILGIAYAAFNQFNLEVLGYITLGILGGTLLLIYFFNRSYDMYILLRKEEFIRQEFIQILKILKSSSIFNKEIKFQKNILSLTSYLKENQTVTIPQVCNLLRLSESSARKFVNYLIDKNILSKIRIGRGYCYFLFDDKTVLCLERNSKTKNNYNDLPIKDEISKI